MASGRPVRIGERELLDGGIVDPDPVRKAVADGAKQVTLVLNTPPGRTTRDSAIATAVVARRYPALRDGIVRHNAIKQEAIDYATAPPPGVRVDVVRPSAPTGLGRLSRDLRKIRRAIEQGRQDGRAHLARREEQ